MENLEDLSISITNDDFGEDNCLKMLDSAINLKNLKQFNY